ncbi:hypothetical protein FCI23_23750 [Actinacidiphila oryziradicis]|uniref:Uncharacterized protein n=1 Tax=Actinacidiphila oryziradicis TaxID=2571141 RepID=A0A4U0SHG0_9ACTN|nr:hypothetical protein FCI23_23750 [Actinacidiphila oryziradicis]
MTRGRAVTLLPGTLAEQLLKQLHGRFPLNETDPPVGQDEPSAMTTTQFPPRTTLWGRRPPAVSLPSLSRLHSSPPSPG